MGHLLRFESLLFWNNSKIYEKTKTKMKCFLVSTTSLIDSLILSENLHCGFPLFAFFLNLFFSSIISELCIAIFAPKNPHRDKKPHPITATISLLLSRSPPSISITLHNEILKHSKHPFLFTLKPGVVTRFLWQAGDSIDKRRC